MFEKIRKEVKIMSGKVITSEQAYDLLMLPENSHKFFSGQYIKVDGTVRDFNGRRNVRKYLKGGELRYNPHEKGNVVYWDRRTYAYRTIRTDNLLNLKLSKQSYLIVNPPKKVEWVES